MTFTWLHVLKTTALYTGSFISTISWMFYCLFALNFLSRTRRYVQYCFGVSKQIETKPKQKWCVFCQREIEARSPVGDWTAVAVAAAVSELLRWTVKLRGIGAAGHPLYFGLLAFRNNYFKILVWGSGWRYWFILQDKWTLIVIVFSGINATSFLQWPRRLNTSVNTKRVPR